MGSAGTVTQRDDPHKGQFAAEDCGSCHSETGYKLSTFDVSRHQRQVAAGRQTRGRGVRGARRPPAERRTIIPRTKPAASVTRTRMAGNSPQRRTRTIASGATPRPASGHRLLRSANIRRPASG